MSENNLPASHFQAVIIKRSVESSKAVLDLVRAARPDFDLNDEDVFVWPAVISNQSVDSYHTKMAESSLKNYAKDATDGVAFMNSHRHNELALGYSMRGTFEDSEGEEYPRVIADFYTVRGLNLNGLETDQFIRGVETGIIRDVSIGFSGGSYKCSICGCDLFDYECRHIPGVEYKEVENSDADPEDQIERSQTAFAWVENARLSEVSAVFDGATPGAMILKAQREKDAGRISPKISQFLESRYRIELKDRIYIPANTQSHEERKELDEMDKDKETSGAPEKRNEMLLEVRGVAKACGLNLRVFSEEDVIEAVKALGDELERMKTFEPLASEAKLLRARLVEDSIKEGIRAFGDKFDKDRHEKVLATLDIESVDALRASWKQIGDSVFVGKARQSTDEADPKEEADEEDTDESKEEASGKTVKPPADEDFEEVEVGDMV